MTTVEEALRLAVALGRGLRAPWPEPKPGALVVEITARRPDPDAIGWLIAHGLAPYREDGHGAVRDVWDVLPLNPAAELQTIGGEQLQRWENATFIPVPDYIVASLALAPPPHLRRLVEAWAA